MKTPALYEYKVQEAKFKGKDLQGEDLEAWLNSAGEQGWRVIDVIKERGAFGRWKREYTFIRVIREAKGATDGKEKSKTL